MADHPQVRFPPPLAFLGFVLLGFLAHRLFGLARDDLGLWHYVAIPLALAGIWLVGAALLGFRRVGENPEPWTGTATVVEDGPYRVTRNPMYLGMLLLCLAVAAWFGSLPVAIGAIVAAAIIDRTVIRAEEHYLSRTLGERYEAYRRRVRRWL